MPEEIILENELETPLDWKSDIILYRDGRGNVIEQEVPDDREE